jgi:glycosidase
VGELKKIKPDVYTVAEVWDGDGVIDQYIPYTNCFNFPASQSSGLIAETAKAGNVNRFAAYVEQHLRKIRAMRPDAMNVFFIANHDTDRAAGYLTVASGQAKMAANLYLLSPGSPFIYYGEEIGMRGSRGGANTDANRRLAMLWGDGGTAADPVGTTYDASKQTPYSVKDLKRTSDSLYNYYKRLIMIRKANPEIARGDYTALSFPDSKAGGFVAVWEGSAVAVIHNTTGSDVQLDLSAATDIPFSGISAVAGLGGASLDGGVLTLEAQTSAVLR